MEAGSLPVTLPALKEWPERATVVVVGPCLNPRLVLGTLKEHGGKVRLWRGARNVRRGLEIPARLDRAIAGQLEGTAITDPIYVPC